jgi:HSP20 family molecular chaperone IbpA
MSSMDFLGGATSGWGMDLRFGQAWLGLAAMSLFSIGVYVFALLQTYGRVRVGTTRAAPRGAPAVRRPVREQIGPGGPGEGRDRIGAQSRRDQPEPQQGDIFEGREGVVAANDDPAASTAGNPVGEAETGGLRPGAGSLVELAPDAKAEAGEPFDVKCKMDVAATRDGLELTLELPGLKERDLEIEVADGVLTIRGEIKIAPDRKDKDYHVVERNCGAFSRSIPLPQGVRADRIRAVLHLGVLVVTIPNPTRPEPKKIVVQAGSMYLTRSMDGLELTVEMPGLEEQDVEVAVSDGVLTVRGERRAPADAHVEVRHPVACGQSVFSRLFELPDGVSVDKITAVLRMGVLKVSIPIPARMETRKIEVRAAA